MPIHEKYKPPNDVTQRPNTVNKNDALCSVAITEKKTAEKTK